MINKQKKCVTAIIVWMMLCFASESVVYAQRRQSSLRKYGRNSDQIKSLLDQVGGQIAPSVCSIQKDGKQVALGLLMSNDGLIVTKHSEVQDLNEIHFVFGAGQSSVGSIVAVQDDYDLALIKSQDYAVDFDLDWTLSDEAEPATPTAGQIVFAPDGNGKTISMGIVATESRKYRTRQFQQSPRAFLGVECRSIADEEGLSVRRITKGSAASKAKLKSNDRLLEIDGVKLNEVGQLVREIRRHQPGDSVRLLLLRDEESITINAILGTMPAPTEQDKWGGGPFSERRFGFPAVIAHDSLVRPHQCGGPLLNTDGQVIGLNIARALRSTTYAVPIEVVRKFVSESSVSN